MLKRVLLYTKQQGGRADGVGQSSLELQARPKRQFCISKLVLFVFFQSGRSDTVDLNDSSLQVDISDALSEREKVKFTVHTKVSFCKCLDT